MSDGGKTASGGGDGKSFREKCRELFFRAVCGLKDAVYPERVTCDLCEAELTADTRYPLCADCTEKMPFVRGHSCLVCGVPINDEADYCLRCQRTESAYGRNVSPLVYDGKARELVYALKFGGKKYIARTLGAMMSDAFLSSGAEGEIIVPVPMTDAERKRRGFNQSELLAREVGRRLNIPVLPALVKTRDTRPQKELSGRERADNLKGCFAVAYGEYIAGRKILLVDDVFTTGATADECARALLKGKARKVNVLTAAVTKTAPKAEPPAEDRGV